MEIVLFFVEENHITVVSVQADIPYLLKAVCIIHFRPTGGDIKELCGRFSF